MLSHEYNLAKERIVLLTEVFSKNGCKLTKAWYTAIAAFCRNRTLLSCKREEAEYVGLNFIALRMT